MRQEAPQGTGCQRLDVATTRLSDAPTRRAFPGYPPERIVRRGGTPALLLRPPARDPLDLGGVSSESANFLQSGLISARRECAPRSTRRAPADNAPSGRKAECLSRASANSIRRPHSAVNTMPPRDRVGL